MLGVDPATRERPPLRYILGTIAGEPLALVRAHGAPDLARPMNHLERGDMTLETIVETMGGHDRNDLKQVEEIAG